MGDYNVNREKDIVDVLILLSGLQRIAGLSSEELSAMDCDGIMTASNLLLFLPYFGAECNSSGAFVNS